MIELRDDQLQALDADEQPATAVDPRTGQKYRLIKQEVYELVCGIIKPYNRGWDPDDEEPVLRLPSDSREFFAPFKQTLQQNEASVLESSRRAIRDQLAALAKRTRPFVEDLAGLLAYPKTRERAEEFDRREKEEGRRGPGRGLLNILTWAADPTGKAAELVKQHLQAAANRQQGKAALARIEELLSRPGVVRDWQQQFNIRALLSRQLHARTDPAN